MGLVDAVIKAAIDRAMCHYIRPGEGNSNHPRTKNRYLYLV
jgi:hypothetical protein